MITYENAAFVAAVLWGAVQVSISCPVPYMDSPEFNNPPPKFPPYLRLSLSVTMFVAHSPDVRYRTRVHCRKWSLPCPADTPLEPVGTPKCAKQRKWSRLTHWVRGETIMNIKGVHSWVHPKDKEDVRGIGPDGESDLHFHAYVSSSLHITKHFTWSKITLILSRIRCLRD